MQDLDNHNVVEHLMENAGNVNQENTFPPQKKTLSSIKIWAGIFLLALLLIVGVGWYTFFIGNRIVEFDKINQVIGADISKDTPLGTFNYTIPGVPYFSLYNHVGNVSYLILDTDAALASILEYWNPSEYNFTGLLRKISTNAKNPFITLLDLENYVLELDNYVTKQEYLGISDIKKYVNQEVKTPLLLFSAYDVNQLPGALYYPLSVIIGINESEQTLTLHNYWLGNNYKISFEDFATLQERKLGEKNIYLIIQPKTFKNTLLRLKENESIIYPERGVIMNESLEMVKNYTTGTSLLLNGLYMLAEKHLKLVINDQKFEKFMPPYLKVMSLTFLAEAQLALGKDNEARNYVIKAIELNHDLDKSFQDWPGYEVRYNIPETITDRVTRPYIILGNVYKKSGLLDEAKVSYEKALAINANDVNARTNLRLVNKHLAFLTKETSSSVNTVTFKNMLVQNSPWSVSWESSFGNSGTQKISFSAVLGGTNLRGSVISSETRVGDMENLIIEDNCVSFTFSVSGTRYKYCLTESNILEGIYSGVDARGNFFLGSATAKPSGN
ncbi:tetratricopeptide repeat protein [Candidatus Kaiserbacteria bacterium]|nr:tetratricopeptide repeat protein [Candidatus Kaiserbacteria bacterium]